MEKSEEKLIKNKDTENAAHIQKEMIELNKNYIVTKGEKLLKARYQLGELALKLISIIYSNVRRSDEVGKDYQIKVSDIAKLMNKNYGDIYKLLKEATDQMLENPIKIDLNESDDPKKKKWVKFNWISDALYENGIITFTISKRLKPFILDLQKKFVQYRLENILNLKGTYVIRLYEILKDIYNKKSRYEIKPEYIISVAELKEMLEIPKSYQYSSGIKIRILEKAKKQFLKHTDLCFEYEEIKEGKKVTHLKFILMPNMNKIEGGTVDVEDNYIINNEKNQEKQRKEDNYSTDVNIENNNHNILKSERVKMSDKNPYYSSKMQEQNNETQIQKRISYLRKKYDTFYSIDGNDKKEIGIKTISLLENKKIAVIFFFNGKDYKKTFNSIDDLEKFLSKYKPLEIKDVVEIIKNFFLEKNLSFNKPFLYEKAILELSQSYSLKEIKDIILFALYESKNSSFYQKIIVNPNAFKNNFEAIKLNYEEEYFD